MILYDLWLLAAVLLSVAAVAVYRRSVAFRTRLPPGPSPLPFVGNLLQVPREDPGRHFAAWKDLYGPINYFRVFGKQYVVLNDRQAMIDLLEKRTSVYSTRPEVPMAKLAGRDKTALFLPAGNRSKETRKLMLQFLGPRSEHIYMPVIEDETYLFLHRLLRNPRNFFDDIKRLACRTARFNDPELFTSLPSAAILKLVYGYQINYENDYFVELAEKLGRITAETTETGRWIVNAFPFLRHFPSWFPGMKFKRWALEARSKCESFMRVPHEYVKTSMMNGRYRPSFTSYHLERQYGANVEAEEILVYAAASLYAGATDTMVSVLKLFFLMMVLHPEVQACAQQEIDELIGDDRVPCVADQDSLPYIECVLKELMRVNPVGPIIIHSPEKDDVYEGYTIPKGCWIMANAWSVLKDPMLYPEPDAFKPERFDKSVGKPQPDPRQFIFGFGRRACPGQYFGERALRMAIASILWGFNIAPERDGNNREIPPQIAFSKGLVVHPLPFRCSIKPRSSKSVALIEELMKKCEQSGN